MSRWDRVGLVASAACAVHCTLLPLLAALSPLLGAGAFRDERVEWLLVGGTAVVGIVGHARAYRRDHRHVAPGLIFGAGLALLLVGRAAIEPAWLEPFALGVGGAAAAASHYANLRLCRCCADCTDDAGAEPARVSAGRADD